MSGVFGCHWRLASAEVGTDALGEICLKPYGPSTVLTGQSPVAHGEYAGCSSCLGAWVVRISTQLHSRSHFLSGGTGPTKLHSQNYFVSFVSIAVILHHEEHREHEANQAVRACLTLSIPRRNFLRDLLRVRRVVRELSHVPRGARLATAGATGASHAL